MLFNTQKMIETYRDDRYILGQQDGLVYLMAGSRRFTLSCHPYEPCLYIKDENGSITAVHNAFDPSVVLECFEDDKTVTSITGMKYDAGDFCRMVEYAAGRGNMNIDDAEKVFGNRAKNESSVIKAKKEKLPDEHGQTLCMESGQVIKDENVSAVLMEYPDLAIDYCMVKNELLVNDGDAHRCALGVACRELFEADEEEEMWHYDCGKADGRQVAAEILFAVPNEKRGINYRGAFLYPPYGVMYSEKDFDRVNDALFPEGRGDLEVFEWTTDWSEYFDDGHEWWGALCYTVYDKNLERFVVILASATD